MSGKYNCQLTQFNNGLVSPEITGRTDLQQTAYSCRTLKNMLPTVFGGVKSAGGSVYAGAAQGEAVLVGFTLNRAVAYMLVFTDYKMRVYKNHAPVMNEDGSVYEALTPYSIARLKGTDDTPRVMYKQIGDVIYMAHGEVPLQKLKRYADNDWRFEAVVLSGGPFKTMNTDKKKVMTTDATEGYITVAANGGGNIEIETPLYFTSGGLTDWNEGYSSDMDGARVQAVFDGKVIMDYTFPGDIWNQNNYNEYFALGFQKADIGILCEVTSNQYMSLRLTDISLGLIYSAKPITLRAYRHRKGGHDDGWRERVFTFGEVSSWDAFKPTDVDRLIRLTRYSENTEYWYAGRENVTVGLELKSDGKFYAAQGTNTCGNVKPTHDEGTASDGKITWKYLHAGYGWGTITKYIDAQHVEVYVNELMPKMNSGTYKWEMGIIGENGVHPHLVGYFKDRLVLGINAKEGTMFLFSKTGDYENFEDMEFGEIVDGCAFNLPVLTDQNALSWLCPLEFLYAGTRGSVLEIKPMTATNVFGPENVTYDVISAAGADPIAPITLGASVLYLGTKAKAVYDLAYQAAADSYEPEEVTLLGQRYLEKGIKEMALAYEPDRVIWMADKAGRLLSLTYNKAQQVRALSVHETEGEYESIAVIPAPDGQTDELWAVVKRTLNGAVTRCVEYFREGLPVDIPAGMSEEEKRVFLLDYAYYVHCGKQFTFEEPTKEITGLDWLEGKEVAVLADGWPEKTVVSQGTITLASPAKVVTAGLPYAQEFAPLPLTLDANGSGGGRSYRINRLTVRLMNSGGFFFGPDKEHLDYAPLRTPDEGNRTLLKSGDKCLDWPGTNTHPDVTQEETPNTSGAEMLFVQNEPLPLHILALYPQVEVSDD